MKITLTDEELQQVAADLSYAQALAKSLFGGLSVSDGANHDHEVDLACNPSTIYRICEKDILNIFKVTNADSFKRGMLETMSLLSSRLNDLHTVEDPKITEPVTVNLEGNVACTTVLTMIVRVLSVSCRSEEVHLGQLIAGNFCRLHSLDVLQSMATNTSRLDSSENTVALPCKVLELYYSAGLKPLLFSFGKAEIPKGFSAICISDTALEFVNVNPKLVAEIKLILSEIEHYKSESSTPLALLPMANEQHLSVIEGPASKAFIENPCFNFLSYIVSDDQAEINSYAIECGDDAYTHQKLLEKILNLTAVFGAKNIAAGDTVLVCLPRGVEAVIVRLALWWIGAVPAFVSYSESKESKLKKLAAFRSKNVVTDDVQKEIFEDCNASVITYVVRSVTPTYDLDSDFPTPYAFKPTDALLGVCSSGTTGEPTCSWVSAGVFSNFMQQVAADSNMPEVDVEAAGEQLRVFGGGFPEFDAALVELAWMLLYGACLVMPEGNASANPDWLLALVEQSDIAMLTPTQLRMVMVGHDEINPDRVRLKRLDLLGELITTDVMDLVHAIGVKDGFGVWGPTQCGPFLTTTPYLQQAVGDLGVVIPGVTLSILAWPEVSSSGLAMSAPITKGMMGVICVLINPEDKGHYNEAQLVKTPDERIWFSTGDLAIIDEQDRLLIKGRVNDVRKIQGSWVSLNKIKRKILDVNAETPEDDRIAKDVWVRFENETVVAYLLINRPVWEMPSVAELREQWLKILSPAELPMEIYCINRLFCCPGSNKIDFRAIRDNRMALPIKEVSEVQTSAQQLLFNLCIKHLPGCQKVFFGGSFYAQPGASSYNAVLIASEVQKALSDSRDISIEKLRDVLLDNVRKVPLREIAKGIEDGSFDSKPALNGFGRLHAGSAVGLPPRKTISQSNERAPVIKLNATQLAILSNAAGKYNIALFDFELSDEAVIAKAKEAWCALLVSVPPFSGYIDGESLICHETPQVEFLENDSEMTFDDKADPETFLNWLKTFVEKPFDLQSGPLARACLIRMPAGHARFVGVTHHVTIDGPSCNIVRQNMITLLKGGELSPAKVLTVSNVDAVDVPLIPEGLYPDVLPDPPLGNLQVEIHPSTTKTYKEYIAVSDFTALCSRFEISPVILTIFILHVALDSLNMPVPPILVPTDVGNPDGAVGYENVTALVALPERIVNIQEAIKKLSDQVAFSRMHKLSLPALMTKLNMLFGDFIVMVSDELNIRDSQEQINENDPNDIPSVTRFPVEMFIRMDGKGRGYCLCLRYNIALMPTATAEMLMLVFRRVMHAMLSNKDRLGVLSRQALFAPQLALENENVTILSDTVPVDLLPQVHALFEAQNHDVCLSHALNESEITTENFLNQVAAFVQMLEENNIVEGPVAICYQKSVAYYAAELACLLYGVPFVLADVDQDKQDGFAEIALGVKMILVDSFDGQQPDDVIIIDSMDKWRTASWPIVHDEILVKKVVKVDADGYWVMNSTSTDRLVIKRQDLLHRLQQLINSFEIDKETVFADPTSTTFDVHLLWLSVFLSGGHIHLLTSQDLLIGDASRLQSVLSESTLSQFTPTLLRHVLVRDIQPTKKIIIGCEPLSRGFADALLDEHGVSSIFHAYSHDAIAIWSCIQEITQKNKGLYHRYPIGMPLPGIRMRIVNAKGQVLSSGVPGFLEIFCHDDYVKTSAIVVALPDGRLVYLYERTSFEDIARADKVVSAAESTKGVEVAAVVRGLNNEPVCVAYVPVMQPEEYSKYEDLVKERWSALWNNSESSITKNLGWGFDGRKIDMGPRYGSMAALLDIINPSQDARTRLDYIGCGNADMVKRYLTPSEFSEINLVEPSTSVHRVLERYAKKYQTVNVQPKSALEHLKSCTSKVDIIWSNSFLQYSPFQTVRETINRMLDTLSPESGCLFLGDMRDYSERQGLRATDVEAILKLHEYHSADGRKKIGALTVQEFRRKLDWMRARDNLECMISVPWLIKEIQEKSKSEELPVIACALRQWDGPSFLTEARLDILVLRQKPTFLDQKSYVTAFDFKKGFAVMNNLSDDGITKPVILIENIPNQVNARLKDLIEKVRNTTKMTTRISMFEIEKPEPNPVISALRTWAEENDRQPLMYERADGSLAVMLVNADVLTDTPGLMVAIFSHIQSEQAPWVKAAIKEFLDPAEHLRRMQLRDQINQKNVASVMPVVVAEGEAPKLPIGVIDYEAVRKQALRLQRRPKDHNVQLPEQSNEVFSFISECVTGFDGYSALEIGLNQTLQDLGLQSLFAIALKNKISAHFEVSIDSTALLQKNIGDICSEIETLQAEKRARETLSQQQKIVFQTL